MSNRNKFELYRIKLHHTYTVPNDAVIMGHFSIERILNPKSLGQTIEASIYFICLDCWKMGHGSWWQQEWDCVVQGEKYQQK